MTTHLTKIWWDLNKHKLVEQAIPEAEIYKREWVGLTDVEIHRTTVLMGFNPEWTTEIGVVHAIVRNLEAKLKERNT